jgi:hypothetical protein
MVTAGGGSSEEKREEGMDKTLHAIGDAVVLALTWLANGGLVSAFWLADHVLVVIAIPAFYSLVTRALAEQQAFALAAGCLGVFAAIIVPPPIPLIILAMAWAGVIAVTLDRFNPDSLRWRVIGGLALYVVAALAWTGYSAYVGTLSAEQWAAMFATDEAASTIAQGRSFLTTISVWGLWIIVPLGYFSLLLQGLFIHAPLKASPERLIYAVRARGEPEGGDEGAGRRSAPAWWPFG